MCGKDRHCECWISLESIGISAQGCLKDPSWMSKCPIPSNQSIFNQNIYIDTSTMKLTCIKNVTHGTFGFVDIALYETENQSRDVYVKRPIVPGKNLFQEACIQKLVGESLARIGFPTAVPKLLHIFALRDRSVCFAMEPIANACTLYHYLSSIPHTQIPIAIIDCLLQLCGMMWHLNCVMGMNHRDLKTSNLLIVAHDTPVKKIITVENEIIEISSNCTVTLIDFGFSCLGSITTHDCNLSLSTVYERSDPCPKEGRDMYLFVATLYIDYYDKLPAKLISLFESWLDVPGSNLCTLMRKDKENSKRWLYFIAGNKQITKFNSCPVRILADLQDFLELH